MDIRHFNIRNLFKTKEANFSWYYGLIYLLIITIPFNHKEAFSVYDPDLVWSKYILVSVAVVGTYFFLRNFKNYIRDPFFIFFLAFVGFQVLSLLQTRDLYSSLRLIGFQSAIAFAYIPIKNYIYSRKNGLNDLVLLYGIVFIPVFIFLLVQIYLQSNFQVAIGGVWPVGGYPTRYGSTFWDINHFGAFCSALSIILLGSALRKDISMKVRIFSIAILILTLSALSLTGSRSSMIGFGAGVLVTLILFLCSFRLKINNKSQYGIYYFGTVLLVSGFLWFLYQVADTLKASLLYRSVSFFSHLFLLKVGIIVGIQNFMLGIGANSFHAYFRDTEWANVYYYIDRAAIDLKLPLHNLWLEVLAETGLVSFVVFVVFWILLLVGLYRIYRKNKDYLALGLIGGLTSFLVAGVMYSYKSEFFWVFVLISAAYVSHNFFSDSKVNLLESIKSVLCPENCDIKKIALVSISAFSILVPFIFITHPLNLSEVNLFTGSFESNLIVDKYTQLLVLFKYIIGNYTYTGRTLSVIFYFGSVSLLFLIIRRYFGSLYSLVSTSLIFGIANIIEPSLIVSIKFYLVFIVLTLAGFVVFLASFINRESVVFDVSKRLTKDILIALSVVVVLVGLVSNNFYFKKSYDTDLTFLLELAYNRRLMDQSLIQVSEDIPLESIYYFSDEVQKKNDQLVVYEGDVMPIQGIDLNYYIKNLFIFTEAERENVNKILGNIRENPMVDTIELKQGNYYILLLELRANPLVYSQ